MRIPVYHEYRQDDSLILVVSTEQNDAQLLQVNQILAGLLLGDPNAIPEDISANDEEVDLEERGRA